MAFDLAAWLGSKLEQKNAKGERLYPLETLQDMVALMVLSGKQAIDKLPEPLSTMLGAFIVRTGLDKVKPDAFKAALDKYFKAHPLPKELVDSFQAEFRREPTGKQQKGFRPIRG